MQYNKVNSDKSQILFRLADKDDHLPVNRSDITNNLQ